MIASSMAVLAAGHGFKVVILARSEKSVNRCLGEIGRFFEEIVSHGYFTEEKKNTSLERISFTYDYKDMKDAEAVVESVVEDLEVKYEVFRQIEDNCPSVKAICSVSSSIVPDKLSEGASKYGDRIVVTHPFNPPHLVPLFEVCASGNTADGVTDYVMTLLEELDRKPVLLNRPTPGFIGNRLQFALWREALALVDEGICGPREVDAVLAYSFCPRYTSIGIFEHFDNGGLELNATGCRNIWPVLSTATEIPPFFADLMKEGKMGPKSPSKTGFYDWNGVDMEAYASRVSAPYWNMFDWKE
jgi:3-hydroxybutyryl-CoA dehydrogenase